MKILKSISDWMLLRSLVRKDRKDRPDKKNKVWFVHDSIFYEETNPTLNELIDKYGCEVVEIDPFEIPKRISNDNPKAVIVSEYQKPAGLSLKILEGICKDRGTPFVYHEHPKSKARKAYKKFSNLLKSDEYKNILRSIQKIEKLGKDLTKQIKNGRSLLEDLLSSDQRKGSSDSDSDREKAAKKALLKHPKNKRFRKHVNKFLKAVNDYNALLSEYLLSGKKFPHPFYSYFDFVGCKSIINAAPSLKDYPLSELEDTFLGEFVSVDLKLDESYKYYNRSIPIKEYPFVRRTEGRFLYRCAFCSAEVNAEEKKPAPIPISMGPYLTAAIYYPFCGSEECKEIYEGYITSVLKKQHTKKYFDELFEAEILSRLTGKPITFDNIEEERRKFTENASQAIEKVFGRSVDPDEIKKHFNWR